MDAFFARLGLWFELGNIGSQNHRGTAGADPFQLSHLGAHPLFHYFATFPGVRPAAPCFRDVEVQPRLGLLAIVRGRLVHPRGEIIVACRRKAEGLQGEIKVPAGLEVRLPGGGEECFRVEEVASEV